MKQRKVRLGLVNSLAVVAAVVCFGGCSGGNRPLVEYVEGTVLLDGKPVAGATVSFSPLPGESGLPAVGLTDARGIFRLSSTRGGKPEAGAVAGGYVVTVSKFESDDIVVPLDPETGEPIPPKTPPAPPRRMLPAIYEDPGTSPLRATVMKGRNNDEAFIFRLEQTPASKP